MADPEPAKEVVRRFYGRVINDRNVDAIDSLLTEDFTHDDEGRGREGQKEAVRTFLNGFSDLEHEIVQILAEGDLVAARQIWRGTHDGEFAGIAATGRRVEFGSTAILRVEHGMIAAAWDQVDLAGLMAQLTG
jgi:steroid delta-isomerase-like uncharacterized protein